jgi:hypothetical protein
MHKRSSKPQPEDDLNLLASRIVEEATKEAPGRQEQPEKNPAAVALGRLGGLKGGRARAEKLSKEQLRDIAQTAAKARWERTKKL